MERRTFLKNFSLFSTAIWAQTILPRSLSSSRLLGNQGRILVVIELEGGCDGLNTVISYTNPAYYASRPNLAISPQKVLKVTRSFGFHPSLAAFRELYEEGYLAVVQGIGYPNPDRSHLRAREIWHTAKVEEFSSNGWLARYLESLQSTTSLQGVSIGGKAPKAMISEPVSLSFPQHIRTTKPLPDENYSEYGNTDSLLPSTDSWPQRILDDTDDLVRILEDRNNYRSRVEYPDTSFAANLRAIAKIISSDRGVKLFYTSLAGFDTHANQVLLNNNVKGVHAGLLETLSSGIKAFYDDMKEMGRKEEVLVMTFSEFGRRIKENACAGTDHGTANQMFLIGGRVKPGFYGDYPGLEQDQLDEVGDIVYKEDFRSVYSTVLAKWLNADRNAIIGESWPLLNFI